MRAFGFVLVMIGLISSAIDDCFLSNFDFHGVKFDPTTEDAQLYVNDSTIRNCFFAVDVFGSGLRAVLDTVRMTSLGTGVRAVQSHVLVRNCSSLGGEFYGYWSDDNSRMAIESSVASNHGTGFLATAGATMTMRRCTATTNNIGVYAASTGAHIYAYKSIIAANATGIGADSDSFAHSSATNIVRENAADGAFNDSYGMH